MEENHSNQYQEVASNTDTSSQHKKRFNISSLPAFPVIGVIIGLIAIVLVIGLLSMFNKPNPKIVELVNNGNEALKSSNYNKAQDEFKKALIIDKNNAAAQTGLINSYSLEGNEKGNEAEQLKQSAPVIEQSINSHPNDGEILMAAGYAYETAGDYQKALEFYKKATDSNPNSAEAWFHLGHVNQFLGKTVDANKFYDKSYALDPKNPLVNMVRGNTFFSQKKFDDAFKSFQTAANSKESISSAKAEALTGASLVLLNRDGFKYIAQADAIAKQAVGTDPNFSPALSAYGTTQMLLGQNKSAISLFNRAITANPQIAKNYYMLGILARSNKEYSSAVSYINSAIMAVENDNTIFTQEARDFNKGLYYYELAKTYNLSGAPAQIIVESLQQAIKYAPLLKARAKLESEQSNSFSIVANNPVFKSLIY